MKNVYVALFTAFVVSTSAVTFLLAHDGKHKTPETKPSSVIGELIDSACFTASDGQAMGADHAECATKCLGSGIPAGILPEGKGAGDLLILLTNSRPFAPFAGQTIKVEGVVYEKTHVIDVKHAYVKDGEEWKAIQLDDEHHQMGNGEEKKEKSGQGHKH